MLCNEDLGRKISSFFVPLYLPLPEGKRHPELKLPTPPNDDRHAHFVYILTQDGGVIPLRTLGGNEIDELQPFKRTFERLISNLRLVASDPLAPRPFPARNAALTLRVVSRYAPLTHFDRRYIDLSEDDVRNLLPPAGLASGSFPLPPELARKIVVALRPVRTPFLQRYLQAEPDEAAYDRVISASLEATVGTLDDTTGAIGLKGSVTLGPRPNLSAAGLSLGHPSGHINAAQAAIIGYLRFDRATRRIEAFELTTEKGWYEYGPTSQRMGYSACARLHSAPAPR